MSEKERQEAKDASTPAHEDDAKQPNSPVDSKTKPRPSRKPGPSIDIGPGPGSDVVATPPRRI